MGKDKGFTTIEGSTGRHGCSLPKSVLGADTGSKESTDERGLRCK